LGLFLSVDKIYLSQTHLEKDGLVLDQLLKIMIPKGEARAPAPGNAAQMPGADLLGDVNRIVDAVRPALAKLINPPQEVVVSLSPQLSLLRYFQMPAISQKFWKTAIPLEAKKHIPFPFHGLMHDFQVFPSGPLPDGHAAQGVLMAVASKSLEDSVKGLIAGLRLKLAALEVCPASPLRFLLAMDKEARDQLCLWVHLDESRAWLIGFNNGIPLIFREADLLISGNLDTRQLGLSGCVDFMSRKLGLGPVKKFFLSGSAAGGPIVETLSREAGLAAETRNHGLSLGLKAGDWDSYAAIGGSMRYLAPSPTILDLSSLMRVTEGERRTARFILSIAGILSAIFIILGLWAGAQAFWKSRELSSLKRDTQIEALFKGKTTTQIKTMIADIEKKSSFLGASNSSGGALIDILKNISDTIPDNIWITNIHFTNPLAEGNSGRSMGRGIQMTISGHATTDSQMGEQEAARNFKEALSQAPVFRKLFHNVNISLGAKDQVAGIGTQGENTEQVRRKQEERTTFIITATSSD
jgi:hypothetical protein